MISQNEIIEKILSDVEAYRDFVIISAIEKAGLSNKHSSCFTSVIKTNIRHIYYAYQTPNQVRIISFANDPLFTIDDPVNNSVTIHWNLRIL